MSITAHKRRAGRNVIKPNGDTSAEAVLKLVNASQLQFSRSYPTCCARVQAPVAHARLCHKRIFSLNFCTQTLGEERIVSFRSLEQGPACSVGLSKISRRWTQDLSLYIFISDSFHAR